MRRRAFFAALGGAALAWPMAAHPQRKAMPVIGWLSGAAAAGYVPFLAAFREGLKETGYVEGQNVAIEYRWADGNYDRLPALAAELVALKVDLIAASGGDASSRAAKDATSTIPIVFNSGDDPVATGLVTSLARPGGNLTGISFLVVELHPKRLELLSDLVPQARVIGLLVNPDSPQTERVLRGMQEAARAKGIQLLVVKASTGSEIDAAFAALSQQAPGALVVQADPFFNSRRDQLVALAARYAVPAIYEGRQFRHRRRADQLWSEPHRRVPPVRDLRRKDPSGRQASRPARPAADCLRLGDQSEDRRGARPYYSSNNARSCQRGHRMRQANGGSGSRPWKPRSNLVVPG